MDDTPTPETPADPVPTPSGPKRVMGGRPVLPKVMGRPAKPDPATAFTEVPPQDLGWQDVDDQGNAVDPNATAGDGFADVPEGAVGPDGQPLGPDGQPVAPKLVSGMRVDPKAPRPADSVDFEHACCKAVRANPEDPDTGGAVQEVRQEPYVTWQGPLKPTARFGAMAALIGVVCGAAAVLGLLDLFVPMLIAVGAASLLVLYVILSMAIASSGLKSIHLQAHRHIVDPKLERGKLFHVTLDTGGSVIPGSLKVEITEQLAPGLRPIEHAVLAGAGRVTYKVRPQGRGLLTFAGLDVVARSFDGMWLAEQEWRLRTTVEVAASLPGITWKALVTGYAPFDQGTPSSIVKLYRDIENEVVREMAAGDKMRDVNWKYFARMGKMIVRQRITEGETTILLVFDCTKTMLMDQAGYRNLDMAVEIAQEFADAGLRRNHECGLIAFNEARILDHVRPTRAKIQIKRIVQHLQNLANHHLPAEGEDPVEILIAGDPENLRLGFGQGLKQRNTASMTVIFFTDLQGTPDEIIQSISKAASSGQRVAVMLMPGPRLRPVLPGPDEDELVMRGEAHTNKMRELLIANGCEFMEINPSSDDFKLDAALPEGFVEA